MPQKINNLTVATFDFETDPFDGIHIPRPFSWGFYAPESNIYKDYWGVFAAVKFVKYLYELEDNYLIYAHNGGKFDFFFLLKYLDSNPMILNGRIIQCNIGRHTLRDSYAIFPLALAKYKKDKFNYQKMTRENREVNRPEILKYLKNDCVYLHELVIKFIGRFGRKLTIASAAFSELQVTMQNKGCIDRLNIYADQCMRKFYYGGRCEAFQKGEIIGDFKLYDIKSAYPFAMTKYHPDLERAAFMIDMSLHHPENSMYFAIIRAVSHGCLPYRDPKTKALLFPNDDEEREYSVTSWEIEAGFETETLKINSVIKVYHPTSCVTFKPFVDKFFSLRMLAEKNKDELFKLFFKLILNSAYGRCAINPLKYKNWTLTRYGEFPSDSDAEIITNHRMKPDDTENETIYNHESSWAEQDVDIYSTPAPDKNKFINVSTAASITGYVRAYLWRTIFASKNVLYCDTDSILCEEFSGKFGHELGEWEHESDIHTAYIGGKKLYAFMSIDGENKMASKGARLSIEEIIDICKNDAIIEWKNDAPTFSASSGPRFIHRKIGRT